MADDNNNVKNELKPTNSFATAFTKVTSVVLGALSACSVYASVTNFKNNQPGFGAAGMLAAAGSAVAAATMGFCKRRNTRAGFYGYSGKIPCSESGAAKIISFLRFL